MESEMVTETINDMREKVIDNIIWDNISEDSVPKEWETDLLKDQIKEKLGVNIPLENWIEEDNFSGDEFQERVNDEAFKILDNKKQKYGNELIQNIEKQVLLQTIDKSWREHLLKLEHLRSVIGFRGYAQRDPLNEYKSEAYELFEVLLQTIGEEVTKFMAFFQLVDSSKLERENKKTSNSDLRYNNFESNNKESPQKTAPATWGKVGRNSQCPCGSGKKYKNCHGKN